MEHSRNKAKYALGAIVLAIVFFAAGFFSGHAFERHEMAMHFGQRGMMRNRESGQGMMPGQGGMNGMGSTTMPEPQGGMQPATTSPAQ